MIDADVGARQLIGLRPIGVGSPWIESLESFLMRLGLVHRVSTAAVVALGLQPFGQRVEHKPDHPGAQRMLLAAGIARMTGEPSVAGLGLGRFGDGLARSYTIKSFHAWCPGCLKGMPEGYFPLVWSLSGYVQCGRHRRPLADACHCGAKFEVGGGQLRDHRCTECSRPLSLSVSDQATSPTPFDRATSRTLERFCKDLQRLAVAPSGPPRLLHAVELAAHHQNLTRSQLASHIGLACDVGRGYWIEDTKMSLAPLARLCTLAGLSIAGLFEDALAEESPPYIHDLRVRAVPLVHSCRRRDYRVIKEATLRHLDDGRTWNLARMARELKCTPATLRTALGKSLSSRVVQTARAARRAAKIRDSESA
jgi:AraC-like DNA-binding protein